MALRSALAVAVSVWGPMATAQDAGGDETLFRQQCGVCHAVVKDEPDRQGPNLRNVVGRRAGSIKGFGYSPAFRKTVAGKPWTDAALDRWLADPQAFAPGTVMGYQQPDAAKRGAIIDYLKTLK